MRGLNNADSNAFCGPGKYDTGFQDETDICSRPAVIFPAYAGKIRFILRSAVIFRNHKIR